MTEYSRMAKGFFTSTGAVQMINLPFQPDFVEILNYTAMATPANHGIPQAWWDVNMGQGFALGLVNNATPVLTSGVVLSQGISTFAAGQLLQFGARQQIVGATAANPVVFNVTAHGYAVGDTVVFEGLYQSSTTGMAQMCGPEFTISVVGDADHFTVKWNGSTGNYTALSGSPTGAYVKKVLYPKLYEPAIDWISAITTGSTTTITTTNYHNFKVGQEIAFRIPASWGTTQLNSLPNVLTPGSPNYGYVISVTDNWTFVCSINSTGFTAYTADQTIASVPGLNFPQTLSVGDVNSGGETISAGSALYPPPFFPTPNSGVNTINGPAIKGAFVNNTSQGFIIGAGNIKVGAASADTSSHLVGASSDVIYWRAYLHDISLPS